jgi:hypothetical protein
MINTYSITIKKKTHLFPNERCFFCTQNSEANNVSKVIVIQKTNTKSNVGQDIIYRLSFIKQCLNFHAEFQVTGSSNSRGTVYTSPCLRFRRFSASMTLTGALSTTKFPLRQHRNPTELYHISKLWDEISCQTHVTYFCIFPMKMSIIIYAISVPFILSLTQLHENQPCWH